jgi:uncharacterized protein YjbJ (UPF0337 family)
MNKDELQGKLRKAKGQIKQAAGVATGNRRLENEGAAERSGGAAQAGVGKATRKIGEAVAKVGGVVTKIGTAIKR